MDFRRWRWEWRQRFSSYNTEWAEGGGYFTNEVRDRFACLARGYQQASAHQLFLRKLPVLNLPLDATGHLATLFAKRITFPEAHDDGVKKLFVRLGVIAVG